MDGEMPLPEMVIVTFVTSAAERACIVVATTSTLPSSASAGRPHAMMIANARVRSRWILVVIGAPFSSRFESAGDAQDLAGRERRRIDVGGVDLEIADVADPTRGHRGHSGGRVEPKDRSSEVRAVHPDE